MSSDAGGGETRRRRDLNSTVCAFSSFSVFLIFLLSSLFPQPLQTFPKTYSTQISQMSSPFSESIQILPEEPSHRASLMAGDLPLGPSDAPCPVEASTAHGDPIFWVEISWSPYCASSEKMVRLITPSLEFFRSATKFARLRTIWYPATTFTSKSEAIPIVHRRTVVEMVIPSSPPPTFPNLTFSWRRKLGYQIMGFSIFGPITFWTYVRNEAPTPQLNRPRFVLIQPFTLSFLSKLRYNTEIGRRRLSRTVPTLTQELVGVYLIGLKQLQLSIIHTKFRIQLPHLICDQIQRDPKPSIVEKISILSDLEGPWRPSSPTVERISAPPSSHVERTCPCFLALSKWLACATIEAKNYFRTSRTLLIVTNIKFLDVFAEVSLTHHDLVCGMLRCSLCLRASMDLSTKFYVFLIYLSIIVVSLCSISLLYPTVRLMTLYLSIPYGLE